MSLLSQILTGKKRNYAGIVKIKKTSLSKLISSLINEVLNCACAPNI